MCFVKQSLGYISKLKFITLFFNLNKQVNWIKYLESYTENILKIIIGKMTNAKSSLTALIKSKL